MRENTREFSHSDYTVGWICTLPQTELVAAGAMLDDEHPVLQAADPNDINSYLLGRIGDHNVVIACLPAAETGKVHAATVAKDMVRSFPAIRFGLMVGIGGGAPYYRTQNEENIDADESDDSEDEDTDGIQDIRLGDVVISQHSKSSEAVIQYDFGKSVQSQEFVRAGGQLNKPPGIVLNAVSMLQGQHARKGHEICELLSNMLANNPRMGKKFKHPGSAKDQLFKPEISHVAGKKCELCRGPDNTNLVRRKQRPSDEPQIHYGTIGSADQVMKDAILRDRWSEREKIKCFEMEAAGLMDTLPCLVIRGICNYADSHMNKIWQPYAAAVASAYAKELLLTIPGQGVLLLPPVERLITKVLQQLEHLESWQKSDKETACLQAFRTTDYEYQKDLNPDKEDGTCNWCLQSPIFRNWQKNDSSCLLWITADPGCGKSVLSKDLVDKRLFGLESSDTTICYFFFKDTSPETRSPANAVAALLHQVLRSKYGRKAMRHALPAYLENADKSCDNLDIMWNILRGISQDPECGRIIFILDALDECETKDQKNLIGRLKGLERHRESQRSTHHLKILVTSRPYFKIENEFRELMEDIPGIRLPSEKLSTQLQSEINHVVHARMSKLGPRIVRETTREELLRGILATENRTYLWLDLIFKIIEEMPRIDRQAVKSLLGTLPKTVDDVYDSILRKATNQAQAKKLLQIIVAATRPLSLNEVGVALAITKETQCYEDLELQRGEQLAIAVRNTCLDMVVQTLLARPDVDINSTTSDNQTPLSLATYQGHEGIVELLLTAPRIGLNVIDGDGDTPLSLAILHGYEGIVKLLLTAPGVDLNLASGSGDPPLSLAVLHGYEGIVKLLLTTPGVNLNLAGGFGDPPLSRAILYGNEGIVKLLHAALGIDPSFSEELDCQTPLRPRLGGQHMLASQSAIF
ncbi:hypothetical protein LT330_008541 [Penicillium expansum]|nr:hypothetical protein LT330_008541 [Penicillium expansum]